LLGGGGVAGDRTFPGIKRKKEYVIFLKKVK